MGCTSSIESHGRSIHELYSFHEKLAQGSFGQVRACVRLDTQHECAVKVIDVDGSCERRSEAKLEAKIWKRLGSHGHVIGLLETFTDTRFNYFVMEKCDRSLCEEIMRQPQVHEKDILSTFRQMLLALEHCHSMSVVHRDVKPANFLVTCNGVVKICDFALAQFESQRGITGAVGSAPFMSPEMVLGHPYNRATDIWSFGATAYLMLYGHHLYNVGKLKPVDPQVAKLSPSELMCFAIATNEAPPSYETEKGLPEPSSVARTFLHLVLRRNANKRLSASQCLRLSAMQCNGPSGVFTSAVFTQDVTPTVRLACQALAESKTPTNPRVARTMDDLIDQLSLKGEKPTLHPVPISSHSGELTTNGKSGTLDEVSECSTTASSGSPELQTQMVNAAAQ